MWTEIVKQISADLNRANDVLALIQEIVLALLLLLLLLLLLQVKSDITIYNYISHKKVDIRQRHKMMAEKGNF